MYRRQYDVIMQTPFIDVFPMSLFGSLSSFFVMTFGLITRRHKNWLRRPEYILETCELVRILNKEKLKNIYKVSFLFAMTIFFLARKHLKECKLVCFPTPFMVYLGFVFSIDFFPAPSCKWVHSDYVIAKVDFRTNYHWINQLNFLEVLCLNILLLVVVLY